MSAVSLCLPALLGYAAGVRGDALLFVALLGTFPMRVVVLFITIRVAPPELEATGEFRGILYGLPHDEPPPPMTEPRLSETPPSGIADASGERAGPLFTPTEQPWSMEGIVIAGGAIVLLLFGAWMVLEPAVHTIVPESVVVRKGPPTFPVSIRIYDEAIIVTNGSAQHWSCHVELRDWETYTATFSVAPKQTHYLANDAFEPAAAPGNVARKARMRLVVDCAEPTGRSHSWIF
jgi:hypothetical protein